MKDLVENHDAENLINIGCTYKNIKNGKCGLVKNIKGNFISFSYRYCGHNRVHTMVLFDFLKWYPINEKCLYKKRGKQYGRKK